MKPRKIQSKKRYVIAFTIATLIFVLGFAFTNVITYLEFQRVSSLQGPTSYKIFQDKIQYTLFDKDICSTESYLQISQDLSHQGQIIGDVETKFGKDDESVLFRKKFYTLIQLEHLEFVKMINERCGKDINIIIFFYSNKEEDLTSSEKLGSVLGSIYERNKDKLVLYSIDLNLDSEIVTSLKEKYNISEESVVILNEEQRFTQINNIREVEKYIN